MKEPLNVYFLSVLRKGHKIYLHNKKRYFYLGLIERFEVKILKLFDFKP